MSFLNQAYAQIRDLFRSMTPGVRIASGLLLAVVVISLTYLFTYHGSGSDEYLLGGEPFSPAQFQNMEAALGTAGLSYKIEGNRLRIPAGQKAKYMAALADADALPPQWGQAMEDALKNESVFSSADQREARYNHARGRELSIIVGEMKDIQRASVMYQCKTERGFHGKTLNTASVSVVPTPGRELTGEQAAAIRNLVAGAISGMRPEDVTVTDIKNGRSFHGSLDGGDGGMGGLYAARKREAERDYKQKILGILGHVPGVTVEPNVELALVKRQVTRTITPSPKGTARKTMEKSSERMREGAGPAGQPGFKANQPNALPATTGRGTADTESQSESVEDVVVGGTEEEKEAVPMAPTRVTVAIGVPGSYFQKVWLEENAAPPGEEQKKPTATELLAVQTKVIDGIQKLVAKVLPPAEGVAAPTDLVQVLPFADLTQPEIPGPTMTETVLVWLSRYWSTLGMLGLAAASLVVLRSMVRAAPVDVRAARVKSATVGAGGAGESEVEEAEEKAGPARRLSRFSGNRESLGDELSELVREDAEAAANILRTWIGSPNVK